MCNHTKHDFGNYVSESHQSVFTYTHHTLGPKILKRLLEISIVKGDVEFLKYLIDDKKVDVYGEHIKLCGLIMWV